MHDIFRSLDKTKEALYCKKWHHIEWKCYAIIRYDNIWVPKLHSNRRKKNYLQWERKIGRNLKGEKREEYLFLKASNSLRHKERKTGGQKTNGMLCCSCHNETMLADKPCFISWVMCKSPNSGEKEGRTSKIEKTHRVGGSEGWHRGLEEENI